MPNISISIPHELTQEQAVDRIKRNLARARTEFSGQISSIEEHWNDNVGTLNIAAKGFTGSARVTVNPSDVTIEMSVPAIAMMFRSKIEETLKTYVSRILA
jgi:hypothetical protein